MKKLIAFIIYWQQYQFYSCGEKKSEKKQEKVSIQQ